MTKFPSVKVESEIRYVSDKHITFKVVDRIVKGRKRNLYEKSCELKLSNPHVPKVNINQL